MMLFQLVLLLPLLACAKPLVLEKRQSASGASSGSGAAVSTASKTSTAAGAAQTGTATVRAGATLSDVYPPPGVTAGPTSAFPDESQVGYPGFTQTGLENNEITTQTAYPYVSAAFPLIIPAPLNSGQTASSSETGPEGGNFNPLRYFGNLSPWYSVNQGNQWGLPNATPSLPSGCTLNKVFLLYRHGARYLSLTGNPPAPTFGQKVYNSTGFNATGALSFLNTWTYDLGAELLTPFGRAQDFNLGMGFRNLYGQLLNNYTAADQLPVWTTESQDRMVKSALNFAAGFFGIPEYQEQVNLLIVPEVSGVNNSGAPYEICTNSNNARGGIGSAAASKYKATAYASAVSRIQSLITGFNVTTADVDGMLNLCAYETVNVGYSQFCPLFTEDDFRAFEYAFDLQFYYSKDQGFGSPVGAAQGLGYVQKFKPYIQRLTGDYNAPGTQGASARNRSYDNPVQSPLNQTIYADATHEVVLLDFFTAMNFSAIMGTEPLPLTYNPGNNTFVASKIVPFSTHLVTQVMECPTSSPPQQIRFILNDAVVPIDNYPGCFDYDCLGNYTVPSAGSDLNGRAPTSSAAGASASAVPTGSSAAQSTSTNSKLAASNTAK